MNELQKYEVYVDEYETDEGHDTYCIVDIKTENGDWYKVDDVDEEIKCIESLKETDLTKALEELKKEKEISNSRLLAVKKLDQQLHAIRHIVEELNRAFVDNTIQFNRLTTRMKILQSEFLRNGVVYLDTPELKYAIFGGVKP
jgi:hypothetical protein